MLILVNEIDCEKFAFDEEKQEQLKTSIAASGLLHNITVRAVAGSRYTVVAGKKRFKAIKDLGWLTVECSMASAATDREISLEENLRRENLAWYEQVELELEFHNLKMEKHGKRLPGPKFTEAAKKGWSQADTAKELGLAMGTMSQDLKLANALKRNPHLKKVKDKITALKLIRQTVRREEDEEEALMPSDFDMNQVFLGDSLDILQEIPANTFDVCITDPPWLCYKDEALTSDENTLEVFREIYRVLKPNALLYAIVSTPDFILYNEELPRMGYTMQKYPLIWYKTGTITHGRAPWQYARDYEPIVLAAKGRPVLAATTEVSSILDFPSMHHTQMIHPHEKPIELMKAILSHSSYDGSKILDPFSGSGVTLQACKEMNRPYIGIERDKNFYLNIIKRLG